MLSMSAREQGKRKRNDKERDRERDSEGEGKGKGKWKGNLERIQSNGRRLERWKAIAKI